MSDGTWEEWSKFVLKELERLNDNIEKLIERLSALETNVTILNVKSGAWGILGGSLAILVYLMVERIK